MQRIDSGSCKVVGAGASSRVKQFAQTLRRLFLAGGRPSRVQARIEDGAGWRRSLPWSGAGLLLLREGRERVVRRPARRAGGDGRGVDQRQPVLGRKLDGREARRSSALAEGRRRP